VDGDGVPEIVQGSGAYLVRAYRTDGSTPAGFPKLTHGWHIASPALGDVDGDGLVEVVAMTREGNLFVWDTPGLASAAALPWAGFGRDRRNTQNLSAPVANVAPAVDAFAGLGWTLEAIEATVDALRPTLPARQANRLRALSNLVDRAQDALGHGSETRVRALLAPIERKLRKNADDVAELDPLHGDFVGSVRDTLRLSIEQTDCGEGGGRCNRALERAQQHLAEGDAFAAGGNERKAVLAWRKGLKALE
jgi:hypothetical protein